MGDDQSLNPDEWDKQRAIEKMDDLKGSGLIDPELAYCLYKPFHEYESDDDTRADEVIWELQYAAGETNDLIGVPAFTMVVPVHDISAAIVERMGEDPATSSMRGRGSSADSRHRQDLSTIKEEYGEAAEA